MSERGERKRPARKLHAPTRKKVDDGEDRLILEAPKPEMPQLDATGKWRREVSKMGRRLGYPDGFLWHWFEQLAYLSAYETEIELFEAERMGFRLLGGLFDKVALGMDVN